ncbi:MAG: hypothetical protein EZS28_016042, partial [Streblomastix strix]
MSSKKKAESQPKSITKKSASIVPKQDSTTKQTSTPKQISTQKQAPASKQISNPKQVSNPKQKTEPKQISTPKQEKITKEESSIDGSIDFTPQIPSSKEDIEFKNSIFKQNSSTIPSTILFDPVIRNGVTRFEIQNIQEISGIGIADESVHYGRGQVPQDGGDSKIVFYKDNGDITHFGGEWILNMDSTPRTLTFFINGKEQPNYIIKVPPAVRFWVYLQYKESAFKVIKFNSIKTSSAKHAQAMIFGQIVEWLLAVVAAQTFGDFQVASRSSQLARDGGICFCEFGSCASHVTFEACSTAKFDVNMIYRAYLLNIGLNQLIHKGQKPPEILANKFFDNVEYQKCVYIQWFEAAIHPGTFELDQICSPPSQCEDHEAGNNVDQCSRLNQLKAKLIRLYKYDMQLADEQESFVTSLNDYVAHPEDQSSLMNDLHLRKDSPTLLYVQNRHISVVFYGLIFILILLRTVSQTLLSNHLSNTEQQHISKKKEASSNKQIFNRIFILLIFSSTLLTAQTDLCNSTQVLFTFDDGRAKCVPNTCIGSNQVWVDVGTDTPLCYTNVCGDKYIDVADNHVTITCQDQCSSLKTPTELSTSIKKCVDACPAGQFRFRYHNGSYSCQRQCSGYEKALQYGDGTVACVVNNCQDPTPVLSVGTSTTSCVNTNGCPSGQTAYESDDDSQVCYSKCSTNRILLEIDQMQPVCFDDPKCTSKQYININNNNQISCVADCGTNGQARRYDNGTLICSDTCPNNKRKLILDDNTFVCLTPCDYNDVIKYNPDTKSFICIEDGECQADP